MNTGGDRGATMGKEADKSVAKEIDELADRINRVAEQIEQERDEKLDVRVA